MLAISVLLVASCADDDDASTSTTTAATTTTSSTSTTISTSSTSTSTSTSTLPHGSTTASVVPASCAEVLENGCEGEAVERLQRLLRTRVNGTVAIDGSFGDQTEGALRTFEQFDCPVATCTVDGRILIDGPEWDVLTELPELTKPTFELSP